MKLLDQVDVTLEPLYVVHDVPIYCHNHPTQSDVFNAALKALKDILKDVDWPEISGHQVLSLAVKNVTDDGNGNLSIDVSTLENPVTLGTIQLRDEAGVLEYSTDAGVTWLPINKNDEFDTHAADASIHFEESGIDHANILSVGTHSHEAIDTHIADAGLHTDTDTTDHTLLTNIGTHPHTDIDAHMDAGYGYGHGVIDTFLDDLPRQLDIYQKCNNVYHQLMVQKYAGAGVLLGAYMLSDAFVDISGIDSGTYAHDAVSKYITIETGNNIVFVPITKIPDTSPLVFIVSNNNAFRLDFMETTGYSSPSPGNSLTTQAGDMIRYYRANFNEASLQARIVANSQTIIKGIYIVPYVWASGT